MIVELYESHTITAANIVREYGIGSATLYKWVGQYGKIQTPDGELTNNKEIKKLKKELNDLKIENECSNLDGMMEGTVKFGKGSTIVDCVSKELKILREGPITIEQIRKVLD